MRKRLGRPVRSEAAAQYDAFISYFHAADGKLAPALQAGLQRLAKPRVHGSGSSGASLADSAG